MTNKITELKNSLGVGARPAKYRVYFAFPSGLDTEYTDLEKDSDILCKSTTIPGMSIGVTEVWSHGRKLPIPGDATYSNNWSCTFYCTEEHNLRRTFSAWIKAMDHFQSNSHAGTLNDTMCTMTVVQLDSDQNETVTYELHNVFPTEVTDIQMSAEMLDQVIEFDVQFSYSDWTYGHDENRNQPGEYNHATLNKVASN